MLILIDLNYLNTLLQLLRWLLNMLALCCHLPKPTLQAVKVGRIVCWCSIIYETKIYACNTGLHLVWCEFFFVNIISLFLWSSLFFIEISWVELFLALPGPFRVNGVPLRRVNQTYVIASSTKVDISGVSLDKFDDKYFAKQVEKKKKKGEGEFFEAEKEVCLLYATFKWILWYLLFPKASHIFFHIYQ